MAHGPESHRRTRRSGILALAALVAGAALIAGVAITSVVGATPGYAASSCDSSGSPVRIKYEAAVGSYPGVTSAVAVSGIVMTDFPAACNGSAVKLEVRGNSAGDPSLAPAADRLLSTADSTVNPCTQKQLSHPGVVTNAAISLVLCPAGGPAGYFSVHDVTLLSLFLAEASGGVVTTNPTPTPTPSPTGGVAGISVVTPSTGSASPVTFDLLGLGVALMLVGGFAVGAAWYRRRTE
jgi:hypothetical protein